MPTLTIDGLKIEVAPGTTILEAAASLQIDVPHFCYHPALSRPANCRMCLVEVEKAPKLMPSCYSQVMDGMVVHTQSPRVVRARKAVLEFILLNHPVDCPICDQAGECKLQDYYFAYSAQQSRLSTRKVNKVKVFPIGPEVVYDGERCILCTRCVRFCEEVSKTNELTTVQRADMSEIRTFPGMELDNDYSLCTVDLCPVGALTSRDFRFKCRVWYLKTSASVCTGCAKGCNIHLEHFKDEVQRYRPRPNPEVNKWWMCDHGRKTYKAIHEDRLLSPSARIAQDSQEYPQDVSAQAAIGTALRSLRAFIKQHSAGALGVVLSPQASCEELFALLDLAKTRLGVTRFYINGKPDNAFTLRKDPSKVSDDLLIQADKNPNRAGLLRLAEAFGVEPAPAAQIAQDIQDGHLSGLYVSGSDFPLSTAERADLLKALRSLALLIYAGAHTGPLASIAHLSLPVCTHAEKDGSFINCDGVMQSFTRAFEPHGLSLPEWLWLGRISKRLFEQGVDDFATLQRQTAQKLASAAPAPAQDEVQDGAAAASEATTP